jgi:hypothetical protein
MVGNRSEDSLGGAVYCLNSDAYFGNCTISGNYGGEQGAGVHLIDSAVSFEYSLIVANTPFNLLQEGAPTSDAQFRLVERSDEDCALFRLPGYWADSPAGVLVVDPAQPGSTWIRGDYHLTPEVVRRDVEALSWVLADITGPCRMLTDLDPIEVEMGAYGRLGAAIVSESGVKGPGHPR